MGSPGGGVGSSGGPGGGSPGGSGPSGSDNDRGGASGNDNDRGGPSGSDRDSSNDRNDASRADTNASKNESSQRGMTGSERTESFNNAMSDAAKGPDADDDKDDDRVSNHRDTNDITAAGDTFGGLSDPSTVDTDRTADDAAQAAARASHPANEFSGLGPSGGPIDNTLSGDASRNSHRGYGPDDTMAGGIDDDVNAGLGPTNSDQDAVTPGYDGGATADDGFGFADGPPEHQFSGGVNTAAAATSGLLNADAAYVDHRGRNNAADIATRGNAGRFADIPGHPDRASYAKDLREGKISAAKALDNAPFGPNAKTTQALSNAARTAGNLGRIAGPIGTLAGPAAEITEGVMNAEGEDKVEAAIVSAAATTDDIGAGGLGTLVGGGIGTLLGGPGLGTGIGAAIGGGLTSYFYDGSAADKAADAYIKDQMSGDHRKDDERQTIDFGPMP